MKAYRHISVRLDAELHKRVKEVARKRDLTVSQQVRHYLTNLVEQDKAISKGER